MLRAIGTLMAARTASSYDASAQALFNAAQITSITVKNAVNTLIIAAKTNGWWDLCNAIYGFAGDDISQTYESQYKYNWKDPQDTDAALRQSFTGGWTHGSTGSTPNGTTGYADTHFAPSTLSDFVHHLSVYLRTDLNNGSVDIGCEQGNLFVLQSRSGGSTVYTTNAAGAVASGSVPSSLGYFMGSRESSTSASVYRNGSSTGTNTGTETGALPVSRTVYIGAENIDGVAGNFSAREICFATIGAGISGAIAALMYSDIQTYQTSLSRNV